MKKTQKKLGNKGFSLVELIVVIAIMAVLVGVLAPTLIRNVEKSRESTDLQNLDSIRQSVVTALSSESVAEYAPTGSTNSVIVYNSLTATGSSLAGKLYDEMSEDNSLGVKMKSSAASKGTIKITVSGGGKVEVGVYDGRDNLIDCSRTKNTQFVSK